MLTTDLPARSTSVNLDFHHFCGQFPTTIFVAFYEDRLGGVWCCFFYICNGVSCILTMWGLWLFQAAHLKTLVKCLSARSPLQLTTQSKANQIWTFDDVTIFKLKFTFQGPSSGRLEKRTNLLGRISHQTQPGGTRLLHFQSTSRTQRCDSISILQGVLFDMSRP